VRRERPATVFYSRRTLIVWVLAASAFWVALLGFFFLRHEEERARELSLLRGQARELGQDALKARAEQRLLEERAGKLQAEVERLAAKVKAAPPPEPVLEEQLFPLGRAVEVVPGRLFVTAGRLEGERLRLRMSSLEDGQETNRTRALAPGESWRFDYAGETYALLLHALSPKPPGARISVRKLKP